MNYTWLAGASFAILAAIFNATVGVINVNLFSNGLASQAVAFLKCIIALVILLSYVVLFKRKAFIDKISSKWRALSICALFGFFVLYTFETKAYETLNVAVVIFILFGSSMITTFILSCIIDKKMIRAKEVISIILSFTGLSLIFSYEIGGGSLQGIVDAFISGVGYGIFLVLSKKYKIGSCLVTLTLLMMFGTLYLYVYWLLFPSEISIDLVVSSSFYLIILAIFPTIGGFYFTIKALGLIKSQSVQLIGLLEPIFAIIFSFLLLSQLVTFEQILGGGAIIFSIFVHEINIGFEHKWNRKQR